MFEMDVNDVELGISTADFIKGLYACARYADLLDVDYLQYIISVDHPNNPIDLTGQNLIQKQAFRKPFDELLKRDLDWSAIQEAALSLIQELHHMAQDRHDAYEETKWIELPERCQPVRTALWAACWSRRDLEGILRFFASDAKCRFLLSEEEAYLASGTSELRQILSNVLHRHDDCIEIVKALESISDRESMLLWKRTSRNGNEFTPGISHFRTEHAKIVEYEEHPVHYDEFKDASSGQVTLLKVLKFKSSAG